MLHDSSPETFQAEGSHTSSCHPVPASFDTPTYNRRAKGLGLWDHGRRRGEGEGGGAEGAHVVDGREGIDCSRKACEEVGLEDYLHPLGLLVLHSTARGGGRRSSVSVVTVMERKQRGDGCQDWGGGGEGRKGGGFSRRLGVPLGCTSSPGRHRRGAQLHSLRRERCRRVHGVGDSQALCCPGQLIKSSVAMVVVMAMVIQGGVVDGGEWRCIITKGSSRGKRKPWVF